MQLSWPKLLTPLRRSRLNPGKSPPIEAADAVEYRTEWERDYDRILFSTPVRRLADKTQVFPLEKHASVRTRLTHSYEVSNLARGMGTFLAYNSETTKGIENCARSIPPVLAAIGLAHDLGNPPFGHQGERAIQQWFERNSRNLFYSAKGRSVVEREDLGKLTRAMRNDFLKFEGNAQTFRLLTRMQTVTNDLGLNLTLATLAAVMKYPIASDQTGENHPAKKKHGYFQSEFDVVKTVFEYTGLDSGVRHPLTWLMEACDDIAYSVLDAEDSIKKSLVSVSDLFAYLEAYRKAEAPDDKLIEKLVEFGRKTHQEMRVYGLSPSELNDSTIQRFRVNAIGLMVGAVQRAFEGNYDKIIEGTLSKDLIAMSEAGPLASALKKFDKAHAYRHSSVLALELRGYNAIYTLMDMLWEGITRRQHYSDPASKRTTPFAEFAYSRISENYRRIFESAKHLPIRYREAQLLTDMVSGMTDGYAIDLCNELEGFRVGPSRS